MEVDSELDFFGYTDSSLICPITRAILNKNKNELQKLLNKRRKDPQPLHADNRKWTAFHVAASIKHTSEYLELLLQHSDALIIDLEAKSFEGETALYIACMYNCKKNVEILLKKRCSPHTLKPDRSSPLHIAAMKGHSDIVKLLIQYNSNINGLDWENYTPLHLAVMENRFEACKVLIESRANLKLVDSNGNSPLHLACQNANFKLIQLILSNDKATINYKNNDSITPVMLAVKNTQATFDDIKYLLLNGADLNDCERHDKLIVLSFAVFGANTEIIDLIYEHTDINFILEYCCGRFVNTLKKDGIFHSLTSCALNSDSPKSLEALLNSKIPKKFLEAPYIENSGYSLHVLTPLAFLFSNFDSRTCVNEFFDVNLKLLLEHDIIYMNEFRKCIEFDLPSSRVLFTNPYNSLLKLSWADPRKSVYLELLLNYNVTPDYCLIVYNDNSLAFSQFTVPLGYFTYYQGVLVAVCKGDIKSVELCLANSCILEPDQLLAHLVTAYSCMSTNQLNTHFYGHASSLCAMFQYLVKLKPSNYNYKNFHSSPRFIDFVSEDGFCGPNLQAICRSVIRNFLRGPTLNENLMNFTNRIMQLPLPATMKDYLRYRS